MRVFTLCFLLICCLACSQLLVAQSDQNATQCNQGEEKRLALVIGNQDYEYWRKLDSPLNDAGRMAEALTTLGFEVILVKDANLKRMEGVIEEFVKQIKGSENSRKVALFYFSGHGAQNTKSQSLLIPIDMKAETKSEDEAILLEDKVLRTMPNTACNTNIIILDACRANDEGITKGITSGQGKDNFDNIFSSSSAGFLIAYATAPGGLSSETFLEKKDDQETQISLYTHFLLENIRHHGSYSEVFENTRWAVVEYLKNQQSNQSNSDSSKGNDSSSLEKLKHQTPWESNSLLGPFYFVPRKFAGGFQ